MSTSDPSRSSSAAAAAGSGSSIPERPEVPPPVPLRQRPVDLVFASICALFIFTTFFPDITVVLQIELADIDALRADPPLWPPMFILEPLHDYARACDLLFLHSPPFYEAMMWGDVLFTGPFYVAGLYAFVKQRNWIRIPAFVYAAHVLSYMPVMIVEHAHGQYASPSFAMVMAFYAPYWLFGVALMIRLRRHRPFDRG